MRLRQVEAGEWVTPVRKGYLMQCCDCGLVHKMDFRLVRRGRRGGLMIQMRAFRVDEPKKPAGG
jgi:hypothetical protein